jgi:hypothetical protein
LLTLKDYLDYFSAKQSTLIETATARFAFSMAMVFASLFATWFIAIFTRASPLFLWQLAIGAELVLAGWFYLMFYYGGWSAYQYDAMCWAILSRRVSVPEQVIPYWVQLIKEAYEDAPVMARLSKLGGFPIKEKEPKDDGNDDTEAEA